MIERLHPEFRSFMLRGLQIIHSFRNHVRLVDKSLTSLKRRNINISQRQAFILGRHPISPRQDLFGAYMGHRDQWIIESGSVMKRTSFLLFFCGPLSWIKLSILYTAKTERKDITPEKTFLALSSILRNQTVQLLPLVH